MIFKLWGFCIRHHKLKTAVIKGETNFGLRPVEVPYHKVISYTYIESDREVADIIFSYEALHKLKTAVIKGETNFCLNPVEVPYHSNKLYIESDREVADIISAPIEHS